jgi:hypothetical protein
MYNGIDFSFKIERALDGFRLRSDCDGANEHATKTT